MALNTAAREEFEGTAARLRTRIADLDANIKQSAGTLVGEPYILVESAIGMSCRVLSVQGGRPVISYGHDLLIGAAHYSVEDAKGVAALIPGLVPMHHQQWKIERRRDLKATLELYEALLTA